MNKFSDTKDWGKSLSEAILVLILVRNWRKLQGSPIHRHLGDLSSMAENNELNFFWSKSCHLNSFHHPRLCHPDALIYVYKQK